MAEELRALIAGVAAGLPSAATRRLREAAADSAHALVQIACRGPDSARRVAEAHGALPTLLIAVAAGCAAAWPSLQAVASNSALVLSDIAAATPDLARRVAEVPNALATLTAAVAAGSAAATPSLQVQAEILVAVGRVR